MEKYGFNGFTVPFNLSSLPLVCGWSTFPSMCFIPLLSRYSWNLLWSPGIPFFPLEKNCVPWSVSISNGLPYNSMALSSVSIVLSMVSSVYTPNPTMNLDASSSMIINFSFLLYQVHSICHNELLCSLSYFTYFF